MPDRKLSDKVLTAYEARFGYPPNDHDVQVMTLVMGVAKANTEAPGVPSRENEPPVGTWVRNSDGWFSFHQSPSGWGEPGIMPFGKWTTMWDVHGPFEVCGPWGRGLD